MFVGDLLWRVTTRRLQLHQLFGSRKKYTILYGYRRSGYTLTKFSVSVLHNQLFLHNTFINLRRLYRDTCLLIAIFIFYLHYHYSWKSFTRFSFIYTMNS